MKTKRITPEMAQAMLVSNATDNTPDPAKVTRFATDMRTGCWNGLTRGKPIATYDDGRLGDGQHRLLAIVESKRAVWMRLTTWRQKDGDN